MEKIIKFIVLIFVFSITTLHPIHGMLPKIYCSVLGNKDVDPRLMKIVREALKNLSIENPESVAIKQMTPVGPLLAMRNLASFTAAPAGIWLDAEYLNNLNEEELEFLMYHEGGHFKLKHHRDTIVVSLLSLIAVVAGLVLFGKNLASIQPSLKWAMLISTGLLLILVFYWYILPSLVKRQEKQADLLAAQVLIDTGKQQIVDTYIKALQKSKNFDKSDLWWYSDREIVEYLEELKKALNEKRSLDEK